MEDMKAILLKRRAEILKDGRSFFDRRGYLEVETPYLVKSPGEEVHLRVFSTFLEHPQGGKSQRFLHTSPEFAMKRFVAATKMPIYQFARVWRNAEGSDHHHPEFTMLEWYRPSADLESLMQETQDFVQALLPSKVFRHGDEIMISQDFERVKMSEAFEKYVDADVLGTIGNANALADQAGVALREGEGWEDLFFRLLLEKIEPHLGKNKPTFLTHWPAPQAALAKLNPQDSREALRFELYAGGLELANAFEELSDVAEQRRRFELDRKRREALYPDQKWEMDEAFLEGLKDLPDCSGIALGFDRLVMLATNAPKITDVIWI
ncbi:EF-P lysine aminoacylase GenX [Acetobacteraceae bacterium]|nr:EF-P lysine aminoacylase GenX [Acetobacteraceae bacterium]